MDIFVAILALCVLIIIHEFGHYICAVTTGMKVDRFSVFGIGPAILKLGTYRDTEFVIGAIPFGAYVQIHGMEAEDEDAASDQPPPKDSPNYRDKPLWARVVVILGGPAANYLAAGLILFGVFATAGIKGQVEAIEIREFGEVSAAREAGLIAGDELVQIGDTAIAANNDIRGVVTASDPYRGQTVDVTVRRSGELLTVPVTFPEEGRALGVVLNARQAARQQVGVGEAAVLAVSRPIEITALQLSALYKLITGQLKADVQGPVGIVKHIARSAEGGAIPLLIMAAFISTLLGMFNLLPLPALDGGRLMFLGYEAVMRRPANRRMEEMVHGIGMLALLALIALVTIGDIRGN